jgi:hypothetical protein
VTREWLESGVLSGIDPRIDERLRAAGLPGVQAALNQRIAELDQKCPGRRRHEVEIGARVPSPEQFRELLDAAVRIARIDAEANPPTSEIQPRDV